VRIPVCQRLADAPLFLPDTFHVAFFRVDLAFVLNGEVLALVLLVADLEVQRRLRAVGAVQYQAVSAQSGTERQTDHGGGGLAVRCQQHRPLVEARLGDIAACGKLDQRNTAGNRGGVGQRNRLCGAGQQHGAGGNENG